MSGIAEVLLNLGYPVSRIRPARERRDPPAGDAGGAHRRSATAPRTSRDADVVVVSSAVRADNPEVAAARAREHPGDPARRDAGRADARQGRRGGGRLATARPPPPRWSRSILAAGRARSDRDHRRQGARLRLERAAGPGRGAGRRGRRVRRLVPPPVPDGRGHHQHRSRAPRPLRHRWRRCESAFLDFAEKVPFYGLVVIGADNPIAARLPARRLPNAT